jgi:hypothetical protein
MQQELEEVFVWLEAGAGADYQAGVLLLQKHSKNRSLTNGLLKKESDANREKLVYELVKVGCGGRMQDVNEVLNHFAQAVQGAVPTAAPVADVVPNQDLAEQPEPVHVTEEVRSELEELTQLMSKVYNQRCQLSNSLAELDPAEGPAVVAQILKLEEEYNTLAQKRRSLEGGEPTTPEQPAPSTAPEVTPSGEPAAAPIFDRAELVKRRNGLRSNISKAKRKADESKTEDKRSEYAQKAGYLAVELALVESQLQMPQPNA